MPRSTPWNAPEWHQRGFTLDQVKSMDVYSFGMLSLLLLFKDTLSEVNFSQIPVLEDAAEVDLFGSHAEHFYEQNHLEKLKSGDKMTVLARQLLAKRVDLDRGQKEKLEIFFQCLARRPEDRTTDHVKLLGLLSQDESEDKISLYVRFRSNRLQDITSYTP